MPPFPPEVNIFIFVLFLSILSTVCSRKYVLRDYRAFMSPEPCSQVLGAAGEPRHICGNRDPINQGHVFFFSFTSS